jgi:eukaryotic-like serine/threonine-protein kinase
MTSERWQRVEQLSHAALDRDASQRASFLDGACAGDESLRQEVESLLAQEQSAEGRLAAPALGTASKVIVEHPAPSLIGRQLGAYEGLSLLGAGGRGEVYRARDTKLNRDVALKILLPDAFALDADRLARFRREAQAVAALNHPHIVTISPSRNRMMFPS